MLRGRNGARRANERIFVALVGTVKSGTAGLAWLGWLVAVKTREAGTEGSEQARTLVSLREEGGRDGTSEGESEDRGRVSEPRKDSCFYPRQLQARRRARREQIGRRLGLIPHGHGHGEGRWRPWRQPLAPLYGHCMLQPQAGSQAATACLCTHTLVWELIAIRAGVGIHAAVRLALFAKVAFGKLGVRHRIGSAQAYTVSFASSRMFL